MKNFYTPENKQEKIEKEKVLNMLRANGLEHAETMAMVIEWTKEQEALVAEEDTAAARLAFEIERADLYLAVGDRAGALECLEDARTQAHQENETKFLEQIMKKMDEIEEQK